jgi:hypothetical protein
MRWWLKKYAFENFTLRQKICNTEAHFQSLTPFGDLINLTFRSLAVTKETTSVSSNKAFAQ